MNNSPRNIHTDYDPDEITKIWEKHEAWKMAQKIIENIKWRSEYYYYLTSLEYPKQITQANMSNILGWYIKENAREEQLCRDMAWAKTKVGNILNVIHAKIKIQPPDNNYI